MHICVRARTTSLPKKHQDMEENNFQETQHREEENNKANSIIKPRDVKGIAKKNSVLGEHGDYCL